MGATEAVYRRLRTAFGPQGWWPVTPRGSDRPAYHPGRFPGLSEGERFEIAAGAVLTQNTNWKNVLSALSRLHAARALSPESVRALPLSRLKALIRSSGYFTQKALKLKRLSAEVTARGGLGRWLSGPLETVRAELLALWGVGPETADSILLYAGGRPVFVVDAYTVRAGRRLGLFKTGDYESVRAWFESRLPRSVALYQEFHALWVALAKHYCLTDPLCPACPLLDLCRTGRAHA